MTGTRNVRERNRGKAEVEGVEKEEEDHAEGEEGESREDD